jgi:hypothetical protein
VELNRMQQLALEVHRINMGMADDVTTLFKLVVAAKAERLPGLARWEAIKDMAVNRDDAELAKWAESIRELNATYITLFGIMQEMGHVALGDLTAADLSMRQKMVQSGGLVCDATPVAGMLGLTYLMIAESLKVAEAIDDARAAKKAAATAVEGN